MKKQFRHLAWIVTVFVAGMLLPELVAGPDDRVSTVSRRGGGRVPLSARMADAVARRSYTGNDDGNETQGRLLKDAVGLSLEVLKGVELNLTESAILAEASNSVGHDPADLEVKAKPTLDPNGKKSLMIGVLTDPYSLGTIGLAAYSTWGREVQRYATVTFFVGSCQADTSGFPGTVVCLDTPDTYPPQKKVFLMWAYLWRHHANDYKWFMKVDHDTYVNVDKLLSLLYTLMSVKYSQQCTYVGMAAMGRAEEAKKLGLSGRPYCSGLGYAINVHCMRAVGPNFGTCYGSTVSNHSDTEFGRCMMTHADAECVGVSGYTFKNIYYQQENDMVYPMKLVSGGQMTLVFQKEPKATHFAATLLHPLKRAEDFYRFHKQTTSELRPVQPIISDKSDPAPYQMASVDLRRSCVHNPQRQKETNGLSLAECRATEREEPIVAPHEAYVLTQEGPIARESFLELEAVLAESGVRAVQVPVSGWAGRNPPEDSAQQSRLAYFRAMRTLLVNATQAGTRRLMIFEEHVMLSCNFKDQLWHLLNSDRCSAHLFTQRRGGLLLLGAQEASSEGLSVLEADRSDAVAAHGDAHAALCYNVYDRFQGSFAGVYHSSTFNEIVKWMHQSAGALPFHAVYKSLADAGYVVRSAFPNLALPEMLVDPLQHTDALPSSQVAVKLRWYEEKFCRRGGQPVY